MRVYVNQRAGRILFEHRVLLMTAVCYGGESRRIAAPRRPPRRGICPTARPFPVDAEAPEASKGKKPPPLARARSFITVPC